jgi:hypothetical protein
MGQLGKTSISAHAILESPFVASGMLFHVWSVLASIIVHFLHDCYAEARLVHLTALRNAAFYVSDDSIADSEPICPCA